jgi:hypothetical protein
MHIIYTYLIMKIYTYKKINKSRKTHKGQTEPLTKYKHYFTTHASNFML